ncbi:MAG: sensor histidine kinase [Planctomycetota bacterium]|jgi:signal transduction histidine kinase
MLQKLKHLYRRILEAVHRKPLSLAEKCRLQFGGAVLFSLILALLIPYFWMNQLIEKASLDAGRTVGQVVYEKHFRIPISDDKGLPRLSESGYVLEDEGNVAKWIRSNIEDTSGLEVLNKSQREKIELLRKNDESTDLSWTDREKGSGVQQHYIRLVRAEESCLRCHSEQGSAPVFNKNQEIGILAVQTHARGLAWALFMNRLWVVVAGLLAATGAMVAFYAIIQRVILRPIRQLRALVNNVADGNYDIRSSIQTGDEYQRLSDAFNHMLDNLLDSQHKLEQANEQLDGKLSELSEKNVQLYKASKLKSEFLANMSHEFRTPLNAILGFAELLREKPDAEADRTIRWAENILSSGRSLLNMINDLLDLAKAEAGKIELRIEATGVPQMLEGLVAFFSPLTEQKMIKVKLDVAEEIPLIQTDSQKVQQILYNLLSNATKFTPERGRILISAAMRDDTTVRISVADTGCGISKENQEKIFEKFRQLDGSITRNSEGTGLGLAICMQLADLLAAEITLESEAGQGARFSLDLPVNLKVSESEGQEASQQAEI